MAQNEVAQCYFVFEITIKNLLISYSPEFAIRFGLPAIILVRRHILIEREWTTLNGADVRAAFARMRQNYEKKAKAISFQHNEYVLRSFQYLRR